MRFCRSRLYVECTFYSQSIHCKDEPGLIEFVVSCSDCHKCWLISLEPTSFKIPFSNFRPSVNKYILEEWQTSWNNSIGNKLLDIKPTIGEYQSVVRNIRREEVVLARLRLGHTRVTHSHLLQDVERPQCVGCDAPFTVRHFLLECGDFAPVRNNCFHVDNMKELFQSDHNTDYIMLYSVQLKNMYSYLNSSLKLSDIVRGLSCKQSQL